MPVMDLLSAVQRPAPRPLTARDVLDEALSGLPGRAKDRVAREKNPFPTPDISPQEEEGLLSQIGSTAMSGLSRIATLLDTPGSVVRGLAAGAPGRALEGIFDPAKRVTGKELIGASGDLAGTATGIGAEILLDPLTYLSLGTSAVTKAGSVASKAGLLPKAVYGRGGALVKGAGVQRTTSTLRDILDPAGVGAWDIARHRKLVEANRMRPITGLLDQQLGAPMRFGVPFTNFGFNVGGEGLAGAFDVLGHTVRYSPPVRSLARIFGAESGPAATAAGQQAAKSRAVAVREAASEVRRSLYPDIMAASNVSGVNTWFRPDFMRYWQREYELGGAFPSFGGGKVGDDLADYARTTSGTIKNRYSQLFQMRQDKGLPIKQLRQDPYVQEYLTRQLNKPRGAWGKSAGGAGARRQFTVFTPEQLARQKIFRNIPGGIDAVTQMSLDPVISGSKATGGDLAARAAYLSQAYGITKKSHAKKLADWVGNLPDAWNEQGLRAIADNPNLPKELALRTAAGAFTNHPLKLLQDYEQHTMAALKTADAVYELIEKNAIKASAVLPGQATETVENILVKSGFTLSGKNPTAQAIAQMQARGIDPKKFRVPKEIAEDATRIMRGFTQPEEFSRWKDRFDQLQQFFKVHALLRPSFFTRNTSGGMIHNIMLGLADFNSYKWTYQLLRGDSELKGLAKSVPAFRGMTDVQATDELVRSVFANAVATRKSGVAGDVLTGQPSFLGDIPGTTSLSLNPRKILKGIGDLLFKRPEGQGPLTRFDPRNVAGVRSYDNVYVGAQMGDVAGYYTESFNRIPAYIAALKKGYAPAEAANKVRLAHVDYSALTKTEKEVFRRLIPFYSFTKGMSMWAVDQLAHRPGGALAQTMRTATRLRSDHEQILPEHVARTLAIPDPFGTPNRYFTGFGLMPEEALNLLGGDPSTILGQTSPLFKGPMELLTGRSFFQAGPSGGRALREMDSPTQRIISNLKGDVDARHGSTALDVLLMNIVPTWVTTARQLTGVREQDTAAKKAINLLTGARVTDVSEAQQDAVIREATQEILRQKGGARTLERVWIPPEALERMSPEQRERSLKLLGLLKLLGERAKDRAELKRAEKQGIEPAL